MSQNRDLWFLGMCSIRDFAKNMGDPYYEPTIMVHDTSIINTQTVGREANSVQSCDEGIVAITEATLPR